MNDPAATLDLKYPFSWGKNEVIDRLEFRRVRIGDLRASSKTKDELESGLVILGRIANLTPAQVDCIDIEDMEEAMKIVADFMPKSPETGDESFDSSPTE